MYNPSIHYILSPTLFYLISFISISTILVYLLKSNLSYIYFQHICIWFCYIDLVEINILLTFLILILISFINTSISLCLITLYYSYPNQ